MRKSAASIFIESYKRFGLLKAKIPKFHSYLEKPLKPIDIVSKLNNDPDANLIFSHVVSQGRMGGDTALNVINKMINTEPKKELILHGSGVGGIDDAFSFHWIASDANLMDINAFNHVCDFLNPAKSKETKPVLVFSSSDAKVKMLGSGISGVLYEDNDDFKMDAIAYHLGGDSCEMTILSPSGLARVIDYLHRGVVLHEKLLSDTVSYLGLEEGVSAYENIDKIGSFVLSEAGHDAVGFHVEDGKKVYSNVSKVYELLSNFYLDEAGESLKKETRLEIEEKASLYSDAEILGEVDAFSP